MSAPVAIVGSGMVSCIGLTAKSSCAAIRCAVDNFTETRYMGKGGQWLYGAQVPWPDRLGGTAKLAAMLAASIKECLAAIPEVSGQLVPVIIGVAEPHRPGRFPDLDGNLIRLLEQALGFGLHPRSRLIPTGRIAGADGLILARELLYSERAPYCIVAGVDSFLSGATLNAYQAQYRILNAVDRNGFVPGEAAGAVLVTTASAAKTPSLVCHGMGRGMEPATLANDVPHRADGLVQAIRAAFADAGKTYADVNFRMTDANGEQFWFKDTALALTRTCRERKPFFDLWHVQDCIGEVGAANVPCCLAAVHAAFRDGYAPTEDIWQIPSRGVLCQFAGDDGARCAFVMTHETL